MTLKHYLTVLLFTAASFFSPFANCEVEWLLSGSTIAEQNIEEGARGWILKVSKGDDGFLSLTGIQQTGTNVTGSATQKRRLDMNAPIKDVNGNNFKIKTIARAVFKSSTAIDEVVLPEELTIIEEYLFQNSTVRKVVIAGSEISEIQAEAFQRCASLAEISPMVFDNLKLIEDKAFSECANLKGEFVINSDSFKFGSGSSGPFYSCSKLEGFIVNGNLVGELNGNLFAYCSSLKRVKLSNAPTNLVTAINAQAFTSCSALESITPMDFPLVKYIGDGCFSGCVNLEGDMVIGNSDSSCTFHSAKACYGAFNSCKKLNSVTVKAKIAGGSVPKNYFNTCTNLKRLHIEHGVATLGANFLYGCTSMRELYLPYRPTSIGSKSFSGIGARQMEIHILREDVGSTGWLNSANHTPWLNLSDSVKNEWLSLSDEEKESRGWPKGRRPKGESLNLNNNQWLVTIPTKGLTYSLK